MEKPDTPGIGVHPLTQPGAVPETSVAMADLDSELLPTSKMCLTEPVVVTLTALHVPEEAQVDEATKPPAWVH